MARLHWVPQRFDWWPQEPADQCGYSFREAARSDLWAIFRLLRPLRFNPSESTIEKWLGTNAYCIRVAVRNGRHVIGACISKHTPDGSRVLVLHVHPEYDAWGLEWKLLLLACCELPECPTNMTVRADDPYWVHELKAAGWKAVSCDTDDRGDDLYDFRSEPLVERGPDGAGPPARQDDPGPAGNESGGHDPGGGPDAPEPVAAGLA